MKRAPLTELEKSIAAKLCSARFPPYSASKRFARDLGDGHIKELSDRGRKFMAYVVHRFRRQYRLTAEETTWVLEWKDREIPVDSKPDSKPPKRQKDRQGEVGCEVPGASGQASLFGDS